MFKLMCENTVANPSCFGQKLVLPVMLMFINDFSVVLKIKRIIYVSYFSRKAYEQYQQIGIQQ